MATRASNRGVKARGSRGKGKSGGGGASRMPEHLQQSYLNGKVAARINWSSPGRFKRCVAQARVHGMGRMSEGACARLYHRKLARWPGANSRRGNR